LHTKSPLFDLVEQSCYFPLFESTYWIMSDVESQVDVEAAAAADARAAEEQAVVAAAAAAAVVAPAAATSGYEYAIETSNVSVRAVLIRPSEFIRIGEENAKALVDVAKDPRWKATRSKAGVDTFFLKETVCSSMACILASAPLILSVE
jgi:hypothetical protein